MFLRRPPHCRTCPIPPRITRLPLTLRHHRLLPSHRAHLPRPHGHCSPLTHAARHTTTAHLPLIRPRARVLIRIRIRGRMLTRCAGGPMLPSHPHLRRRRRRLARPNGPLLATL